MHIGELRIGLVTHEGEVRHLLFRPSQSRVTWNCRKAGVATRFLRGKGVSRNLKAYEG